MIELTLDKAGLRALNRYQRNLVREAKGGARKKFNTAIREATAPVKAELQAAILADPIRGDGNHTGKSYGGGTKQRRQYRARARVHGLRATIAQAVQVKITYSGPRSGVRFRVMSERLPPDQQTLPRRIDKGRWRHPVFADGPRESWGWAGMVSRPWWYVTIDPRKKELLRALENAIGKVVNDLETGE